MTRRNKFAKFLNIIIGSSIGVFIGHALYRYWDYKKHPELYVVHSAPWYTSLLVYGGVTIIVLLIAIVLKIYLLNRD